MTREEAINFLSTYFQGNSLTEEDYDFIDSYLSKLIGSSQSSGEGRTLGTNEQIVKDCHCNDPYYVVRNICRNCGGDMPPLF